MKKNSSIVIKDSSVSTTEVDTELFISLTDMARNKNPKEPKDVVKNWMRSRTTIEFLGIWEQLNNYDLSPLRKVHLKTPSFNPGQILGGYQQLA